jgi:hypothetical protein
VRQGDFGERPPGEWDITTPDSGTPVRFCFGVGLKVEQSEGETVVEQIDSVRPFAAGRAADAAVMLGATIGGDVALRVVQGSGTLCDVVLAAWVLGVEPVDAVLQYAAAAAGVVIEDLAVVDGGADPRCA